MADVSDLTAGDHEAARDAVLAGGVHPSLAHRAVGILGDGVIHLLGVLADIRVGGFDARRDVDADHLHAVGLQLGLQFREVRDRGDARRAPGRPEFDDVGLLRVEGRDAIAFDPARGKFRRGFVTNAERRSFRRGEAEGGQEQEEEGGEAHGRRLRRSGIRSKGFGRRLRLAVSGWRLGDENRRMTAVFQPDASTLDQRI